MRLIDADDFFETFPELDNEPYNNFPSVDITEEQAIDKLHETGWMQRHDKEMTKRPAGKWIETAREYYEAVNERGGGVDEHTPYFVDDIACPKCLAMFSTIDNETERFNCCPNCGAKMEDEGKKERDAYWDEAMKWHDKLEGGRE